MYEMSFNAVREEREREVTEVRNLALNARVVAEEFEQMADELRAAYEQTGIHSGLKKKAREEAVAWLKVQAHDFKVIERQKNNLAAKIAGEERVVVR